MQIELIEPVGQKKVELRKSSIVNAICTVGKSSKVLTRFHDQFVYLRLTYIYDQLNSNKQSQYIHNTFLLNLLIQWELEIDLKIQNLSSVHVHKTFALLLDKAPCFLLVWKICETYPLIGDVNFKCALRVFKQQLALKMRVRCRISILLL